MPYIPEADRMVLDIGIGEVDAVLKKQGFRKGNLNYVITQIIRCYLEKKGISYNTLSDITGVLNDVKTEFERQVVAKYEDRKIAENGGIY